VLDIDQLHNNERECGIRYSAGLWAVVAELESLAVIFDDCRTATPHDILEARRLGLPESLVPFMCGEAQAEFLDYYCCELNDAPAVAVFSIHTVVEHWPSFDAFLAWAHDLFEKQRHTELGNVPSRREM
jgi:hypothetical protein